MIVREETKDRDHRGERMRGERIPRILEQSGPPKPLVERAFELARSGAFTRVEMIERALCAEGYARTSPHWNSGTLRKQLRRACLDALEAMPTEPRP